MAVSKSHFFSKKSEINVCFIDSRNSFSNKFAAFKAIVQWPYEFLQSLVLLSLHQ